VLGSRFFSRRFTVPSTANPTTTSLPALDVEDVAFKMKCCTRTVYRLIDNHHLPAVKVGSVWRVRPEAVDAFLNGCGPNTPADTIADYIKGELADAPPLTPEQRTRLAELLRPVRRRPTKNGWAAP
jgi:excisionase family DNA binding protein